MPLGYRLKRKKLMAKEEHERVNLFLWLPGMFFLGLLLMGICWVFKKGCEKI